MNIVELAQLDIDSHFHPQTEPRAHGRKGPLIIERGEGLSVVDIEGNSYVEGMAGLWCASLGFSEKRLVEAATAQLNLLPNYHTFNHRSNQPCIELSAELLRISPFEGKGRVAYANSGSEAVDSMVKAAWMYQAGRGKPSKRKIISRDRAFHGATVFGTSLCGLPLLRGPFVGAGSGVVFTKAPHYYGRENRDQTEAEFLAFLVADLEATIEREGRDTIAAMIMEPIMGAGGVIIPPANYFARIVDVLRKHDILVLSDEVICGFARTGSWFGCQTFGFKPDMMSVAKGLSSGYQPIGAVVMSEQIFEPIADEAARIGIYGHGITYAGHPVTSAVARETLRIYHERSIVGHVNAMADHFQRHMSAIAQHELVGETRSRGLLGGVELRRRPTGEALGPVVTENARKRGLLVRSLGDVVAVCPPLVVDPQGLERIFRRLRDALNDTLSQMN